MELKKLRQQLAYSSLLVKPPGFVITSLDLFILKSWRIWDQKITFSSTLRPHCGLKNNLLLNLELYAHLHGYCWDVDLRYT